MAESIVSGLLITASAVARPQSSHSLPHGSCATRVPQLRRDRLLYIKQASSQISIVDEEDSEPEWAEYKIKETNMFTVDNYQQVH
uniref:Uncharacterized protein n=2 Tax=Oryza TaxID=4527 RepID=A0A0D3GYK1_9ORYZ